MARGNYPITEGQRQQLAEKLAEAAAIIEALPDLLNDVHDSDGLTWREIAEACGLAGPTVYHIAGRHRDPGMSVRLITAGLAKYLRGTREELTDEPEQ